jgi:hypothetical protein
MFLEAFSGSFRKFVSKAPTKYSIAITQVIPSAPMEFINKPTIAGQARTDKPVPKFNTDMTAPLSASGSIESMIIQRMNEDPIVYSYQSIDELSFELKLRKNIILSARAMNQSNVQFEVFAKSRCNPQYWHLTSTGGFQLRYGVKPSDAIQDIYMNSSQYAFECATAKAIIYYHAVLILIGEYFFNQLFKNIYLYSWHVDPDLGLTLIILTIFYLVMLYILTTRTLIRKPLSGEEKMPLF